mgnify:CR=1 FL=1
MTPKNKNAREAGVWAFESDCTVLLLADCGAGNAGDLAAINTEIVQFTGAHAAQFVDGLTIFAPVVKAACYVHDMTLSEV